MTDEKSKPNTGPRKLHTLIVDDSSQDFELISEMIRSQSDLEYKFYQAKTSSEAKAILADSWIDVVAVDYNLGRELGHQVIGELSRLYPNLAFIMITGVDDPELYKLGIAAGAIDFISKEDNNAKLFHKTVLFAVENKRNQNSLKATNESKNRLMSMLADNLESPLSNLVKSLALVKTQGNQLSHDSIMKIVRASYRSSYEAILTVNSILEWGQSQTGTMKPQFGMVNLTKSVSGVFNLLAIESEKRGVKLKFKGDCGLKVYADEKMLNTVIRTLVANAVSSTRSGDTIEVLSSVLKGKMRISIRNRKLETPPEKLSAMRLGNATDESLSKQKRQYSDRLETCWHLLDLMETSLQIESSVELGTTFFFELPIGFPPTIEMEKVHGTQTSMG